jgi:hypothetical protein
VGYRREENSVVIIVRGSFLLGIILMISSACVMVPAPVAVPPPAPMPAVEYVPVSPGPPYVWVPGYYAWRYPGYAWVPGRYAIPPGPGYLWVAPYWAPTITGHIWIGGHWHVR